MSYGDTSTLGKLYLAEGDSFDFAQIQYKGTDKLLEQGLAMAIRSEAALDATL